MVLMDELAVLQRLASCHIVYFVQSISKKKKVFMSEHYLKVLVVNN